MDINVSHPATLGETPLIITWADAANPSEEMGRKKIKPKGKATLSLPNDKLYVIKAYESQDGETLGALLKDFMIDAIHHNQY
jgi:hypothetical protein